MWDKVFKSGLRKFRGRQSLKNFKGYGLLKYFKDCLPQNLLSPPEKKQINGFWSN